MDTSMTPSGRMTEGQVERAVEIFRAKLRKHRNEFPSSAVQIVFGQKDLGSALLQVLRHRVEAIADVITRHVKVGRTRTPKQVLDATGRVQFTTGSVVATMPKGDGSEANVKFFQVKRWISEDDLEQEFDKRGFRPADPYELAQVNIDDPTFADKHPNGTHWKDSEGKWCYIAFNRWGDVRGVDVNRDGCDWDSARWFGGVSK